MDACTGQARPAGRTDEILKALNEVRQNAIDNRERLSNVRNSLFGEPVPETKSCPPEVALENRRGSVGQILDDIDRINGVIQSTSMILTEVEQI